MATHPPVIHQIVRNQQATIKPPINVNISAVEDYLVYDRHGGRFLFKDLYNDKKTIIIFVRVSNFDKLIICNPICDNHEIKIVL